MEKSFSEKIEEKLIFKTSRYFFLFLSIMAFLGILISILFIAWGLTPSTKREVVKKTIPYPALAALDNVRVLIEINKNKKEEPEIKDVVEKKGSIKKSKKVTIKADSKQKPEDPEQKKIIELLEEIKSLLPPNKYSWEGKGHFVYPYGAYVYAYTRDPKARKYIIDSPGILSNIRNMFIDDPENIIIIDRLQKLINILKDISIDDRIIAINVFTDTTKNSLIKYKNDQNIAKEEYENEVKKSNMEYNDTISKKSVYKYQAIITILSGIASIAFLGMFLVLLSMHRILSNLEAKTK